MTSTEASWSRRIRILRERRAVDFIVTHCCASSTQILLGGAGYRPDAATAYLEEIRQNTRFKKWLFGHYHDNRNVYYITPEFTVLHWLNVYGWRYVVGLLGNFNC